MKPTKEEIENFDITGTVCSMHTTPKYLELYEGEERWEMYSFDRPAYMFWNAAGKELFAQGWTMDEIKTLLQSKYPRWELDGKLGDLIENLGKEWAKTMLEKHETIKKWAKKK